MFFPLFLCSVCPKPANQIKARISHVPGHTQYPNRYVLYTYQPGVTHNTQTGTYFTRTNQVSHTIPKQVCTSHVPTRCHTQYPNRYVLHTYQPGVTHNTQTGPCFTRTNQVSHTIPKQVRTLHVPTRCNT